MTDLGNLLASGIDSTGDPAVSQFAIAFAQKLCYFADSAACGLDDPEFRRVAKAFQDANFDFMTLIRETFSSPLDNHNDSDLQAEADQTVSGVAGIQALMTQLSSMSLSDKVTFATLNVFGRNLNGISKLTASSATGRDHFGDHSVAVMIGKNINAGVYGGIGTFNTSSNGALGATDIDSATGASAPGGDIPRLQSNVAMARTLGVALGIPASDLDADFNADAGGKVVAAAVKNAS